MVFISKSVTDATNVTTTVADLSKIQSGNSGNITEISKASSTAISSNLIAPIDNTSVNITGTTDSVKAILTQVNSGVAGVNSYLQSAVKSITSTFDNSVKGLASGLDSTLSNLFKDTNVKSASAIATETSDPIKTNLIATKLPASSSFKISGFEAGSQSANMSGSSSQFGSNVENMVSTKLSTLMDRFNLDSENSVANGITNNKSNNSLKSIFSTVKSVTQTVKGVAATVQTIQALPNIVAASVNRSIQNNVQSFLGKANSLTNLTGNNASNYYLGGTTLSLLDQDGGAVGTSGTGTDANTANAILSVARLIGCDTNNVSEYSSVDELSSLFNMILSLASEKGLSDLVDSLLNCSMSSTTNGQLSVFNALNTVSGSDITLTNTLLGNISDTSVLYKNQQLAKQIIANSNLSSADAAAVSAALASMSYTPTSAFEIGIESDGSIVVYDETTLNSSEKNILDSLFTDTTMSTYLSGQSVTLQPNGTYWI